MKTNNTKKTIHFIISHPPNPRLIKQMNYLAEKNYTVITSYFLRNTWTDLSSSLSNKVHQYPLGTITDKHFFKRLLHYLKTIKHIRALYKKHEITHTLTSHIDTTLLKLLSTPFLKTNDTLIIQIADLREYIFEKNILSITLKRIDQYLFKFFINKLIITSPQFHSFYYKKIFKDKHFLLENKPLKESLPPPLPKQPQSSLTIGIIGQLIYKKCYDALFEAIKDDPNISVVIYGKGEYAEYLKDYAKKTKNIHYYGPYNFFNDAPKLYASIDYSYVIYDTTQTNQNPKLLLPNKLYESMYFKVPLIVCKDSFLGKKVEELNIGHPTEWTTPATLKTLLNKLKQKNHTYNFNTLTKDEYIGDQDYKDLEVYINA